mmetsp:Transcript_13888/g.26586  ORF Transcript_13888/g.26586 Transcript_13888/m.26586 type:complete len:475 (-) Transcript_13888:109-1533(-)
MITTATMSANEQQSDRYGSMKMHATIGASKAAESNRDVEDADPTGKPKRPLSAYNLFFRDQRELLLAELPSREGQQPKRSHGKINFKDLANTIAAKWKEILPAEKERYEKIASVGREKYVKLAKAWKKKQKQIKKEQEKKEKAALKAATKKPPPQEEVRQQQERQQHNTIQFASGRAAPAAASDMMMNERLVTSRTSQWHSQYSPSLPIPRPHDFVTEVNPMQRVTQLRPELGRDHGIFVPPPAPMSDPVAAFEEEDLTNIQAIFPFDDQQQPMTVASSGSSPSVRAFSFREQTQRSMSFPRMSTTEAKLDYLHPMGPPRMFQSLSQTLPFSPSLNMLSVQQTPTNSAWNNTVEPAAMHQHQPFSPGVSFHTPMRTNSLPCRLPTDSLPVSFDTVHGSFQRDFHSRDAEPIQQEQHRRFHDFESEPIPFEFTNEGPSHHHGNLRHHRSLENSNNDQLTDNMDFFVEAFDDTNDL